MNLGKLYLTHSDKCVQAAQYKLLGTIGLNLGHVASKLGHTPVAAGKEVACALAAEAPRGSVVKEGAVEVRGVVAVGVAVVAVVAEGVVAVVVAVVVVPAVVVAVVVVVVIAVVEAVAVIAVVVAAGVGKRNVRLRLLFFLPFALSLGSTKVQTSVPGFVTNATLKPDFSSTNLEHASRSKTPISRK